MQRRVVIAGSRNFQNYSLFCAVVDQYLSDLPELDEIIILSGNCAGTDLMANRYAQEHDLCLELCPAQWKRYGRGAGPKRNKQMVDAADCVIAFPSGGRGTQSLITFAQKKGIPTMIYTISEAVAEP